MGQRTPETLAVGVRAAEEGVKAVRVLDECIEEQGAVQLGVTDENEGDALKGAPGKASGSPA